MPEHTTAVLARRDRYPTWNLLALVAFLTLAFADAVQVVAEHSRYPLPWSALAAAAAGLVGGDQRAPPTPILPAAAPASPGSLAGVTSAHPHRRPDVVLVGGHPGC